MAADASSSASRIHSFLVAAAGAWSHFKVSDCGTYLGWALGRCSNEQRWATAVAKYKGRVASIAESRAPVSITVRLYNVYALPVLSYLPNVGPPPMRLWDQERSCLHKIYRLPQNTFSTAGFSHAVTLGMPRCRLLRPMMAATASSFAISYQSTLLRMRLGLCARAQGVVDYRRVLRGGVEPTGFDSQSTALYLLGWSRGPEDLTNLIGGKLPRAAKKSIRDLRAAQIFSLKLCKDAAVVGNPKRHAAMSARFAAFFYPCDTVHRLRKKVQTVFGQGLDPNGADNLIGLLRSVACKAPRAGIAAARMLFNGLPTSQRTHRETQLPCLFGCRGERDSLGHYVRCSRFRTILQGATCPPAPCVASNGALDLAGMRATRHQLLQLATAGRAYCTAVAHPSTASAVVAAGSSAQEIALVWAPIFSLAAAAVGGRAFSRRNVGAAPEFATDTGIS